jgi:hypothetical protein
LRSTTSARWLWPLNAKGESLKADPYGQRPVDDLLELNIALQDRTFQLAADQYANGDREPLHEMWMSGELTGIYLRDGIETLRRHGKHDLADHYERALANAPPPKPIDYIGEELRRAGFKW